MAGCGRRGWAGGVRAPAPLTPAGAAGIGGTTLDHPDWADSL